MDLLSTGGGGGGLLCGMMGLATSSAGWSKTGYTDNVTLDWLSTGSQKQMPIAT